MSESDKLPRKLQTVLSIYVPLRHIPVVITVPGTVAVHSF
jgi:hypothetical protein